MRKIFGACASALLLVLVAIASASIAHADAVDDFVRSQMESKHIPGVAIAVVKNGKPVKVKGYGLSNIELQTPVTADTVFRIGSVSKQMLAAAVMVLLNDGQLSLDDKAVKFLDGAPESWNEITVRHLLTHTAGLTREGPAFGFLKVQTDAEIIKSAYGAPLLFKTGENWQYSNLGYFILAEIIAKTAGKPWPQFVKERVFDPLGMTATDVVNETRIIPHRAAGYVYRSGAYRNAATILALRPSGAFVSSLHDMLKWDAALNSGNLLGEQTLQQMWSPVKLKDGSSRPYGFGFQIDEWGSHRAISHGGSLNGFRSWYLRLPEDKLSIIVLTNNEVAPTDSIGAAIAARYIKDLLPSRKAIRLESAQLDRLTGSYRVQNGPTVSIERQDDGLLFRHPAGLEYTLTPASSTLFFTSDDPRIHFTFDGASGSFQMYMNDRAQTQGQRQ